MELKAIELTKKFGSKTAVNALNITLTNGFYWFAGRNGAGKQRLCGYYVTFKRPLPAKSC